MLSALGAFPPAEAPLRITNTTGNSARISAVGKLLIFRNLKCSYSSGLE